MHPIDVSTKHPQESQRSGAGIWLAIIALVAIAALAIVVVVAISDGEADAPPADQTPVDVPIEPGV